MRLRGPLSVFGASVVLWSCFPSLEGFSSGGPPLDGGSTVPEATTEASTPIADAGDAEASGPRCRVGNPSAGAPMVRVVDAGFCIDATEVTNDQYQAFLAAKFPIPPICSWKTTYRPAIANDNRAIGNVDWCDAYAFCAYAGKRLCGGIDGAKLDLSNSLTAQSEWQYACTHGGDAKYAYPYGGAANPEICLYADSPGVSGSRAAGAEPRCSGPAGIFDLSGNVWEWENACDRTQGESPDIDCNLRGGGFLRASASWGACAAVPSGWTRKSFTDDTGIRCCADFK